MRHGIPILLCAAALAARPSAAQPDPTAPESNEDERAVSFEVGTGLVYDSNVAVLDLDTSANAGDLAALAEFDVDYDKPDKGPFDLTLGYNFSQTLHDDFGAFDVRVHRGSGTASYDLGRVDIGATMTYADAALDGDGFLTLAQISPYVSRLRSRPPCATRRATTTTRRRRSVRRAATTACRWKRLSRCRFASA